MTEFGDHDRTVLDAVVDSVSKSWMTPVDGNDVFDIKMGEALAGLDDSKLYDAIVSAIPASKSQETTWDHPIPKSRSQFRGLKTGIAFTLAAYRHENFLGEERIKSFIEQEDFYENLTDNIRTSVSSGSSEPGNYPANSVLGKLLTKVDSLGRNRGFDLEAAKQGIIAVHKVIQQMRPRA